MLSYTWLFYILLLTSSLPILAQDASLKFKHLGIADGLSQSSAYCLFQDKKGFIWIGTTDGLSRYDGYNFRHFKYDQNNPHSIGSNELQTLGQDSAGNLLVGTSVGLDLFDHHTEQFHPIPVKGEEKASRYVKTIFTDSRGTIWVGTARGLATYDQANRILVPFTMEGFPSRSIFYTIAEDAQHTLWFGVGYSILHYDPRNKQLIPLPATLLQHPQYQKSSAFFLATDTAQQQLWIGTEREGVLWLDQRSGEVASLSTGKGPLTVSNDMIRAIGFYKGHTWIGSRNGLYIVNSQRQVIKHYQVNQYDAASLSGNSVLCFMHDNAGSFWVGTFAGGVSIVQPGNNNFSYINERVGKEAGLNYPVVSTILEDAHNKLWIATEGGGVNVFDRTTGQFSYIHPDPNSNHLVNQETIKAIQFDQQGNLWIGTLEGLFYYETATRRTTRVPVREKESRRLDETIYALGYRQGVLWIGTKGGLFKRLADGTLIRYRHQATDSTSIISDNINALTMDRAGGIWIGTELGLSWLPPGKDQFVNYLYEYSKVFNKNAILCIYEDGHGNIWTGTRGGGLKVFNRQQNHFYTLDTQWGLADDIVHAIMEDRQGNLWVSYNQGIARITPRKTTPPYNKADIQVTNYSVNNGLGTNEFGPAAIRTASGQIMFGGMKGIVAFQPEEMVLNKVPPPVVITDLLIKNNPVGIGEGSPLQQSITYTDHITLSYDQAYFTLHFAALNYINPRTNQYAYKLEGLDNDTQWHEVGNQQTATYTNLSAGDYTFKVKAANNDGYWNEQYASLRITVLPPIWKTWYAYLLYALIIAGLLYAFNFYSVKTTRLKNELALQELNRSKDQELMQRKLSFFTNISHEIKTPLTLVLAPLEKLMALVQGRDKETAQLQLMQRNGQRLLRLTNQLLDFRKFEAGGMPLEVSEGNMAAFVQEIVQSFEAYAAQLHIRLSLEVQADTPQSWFDADKLEKILYNLLSNAFKFTAGGGQIRVTLNCTATQTSIRVEDNGAGIAPERLETIFDPFHHYNDTGRRISGTGIGLTFTKGLVTLHHGTIEVSSELATPQHPGHTCFTITLPAAAENYTAAEKKQSLVIIKEDTVATAVGAPVAMVAADEPAAAESKPVLLIVEDNEEVNTLLRDHFADRYTIQYAFGGEQGWEMALESLPELIISDVMMPGLSGTELCSRLKNDLRTSHIPIILLTARSGLPAQLEGLETGADDYITKPFHLALLDVRVQNLLQSRRQLRERYSRDLTLQPSALAITPADEVFLEKLLQHIEDNLMEPTLQVDELGKVVNMSRTTLYRKLKALTGLSAIEFIRDVRLKRSAQLLQRKEYTVNEVAYMVGFTDVDYFRKCFKQQFGKTPKEYAHDGNNQ